MLPGPGWRESSAVGEAVRCWHLSPVQGTETLLPQRGPLCFVPLHFLNGGTTYI